MPAPVRLAIVGDRDPRYVTHVGTEAAFLHAARALGLDLRVDWVPTSRLESSAASSLRAYRGILIAPGSPYRSTEGALRAIRWAREEDVPILGTCGGFQHMVIEFARNVLGVADAEHAEEHPTAGPLYVTPLACSLVGMTERVILRDGTRAFRIYGRSESDEQFHCRFGLNPEHRSEIEEGGLRTSGVDRTGEVRVMELPRHRFFLGTLFVPQVSSLPDRPHPLILALVGAAAE